MSLPIRTRSLCSCIRVHVHRYGNEMHHMYFIKYILCDKNLIMSIFPMSLEFILVALVGDIILRSLAATNLPWLAVGNLTFDASYQWWLLASFFVTRLSINSRVILWLLILQLNFCCLRKMAMLARRALHSGSWYTDSGKYHLQFKAFNIYCHWLVINHYYSFS